jgi:pyruvate-formate lyase
MMDWLAGVYINSLNVIHYMHDKYSYERIEMALHDTEIISKSTTRPSSLRIGLTCAYLIADNESAATDKPAIPVAKLNQFVTKKVL